MNKNGLKEKILINRKLSITLLVMIFLRKKSLNCRSRKMLYKSWFPNKLKKLLEPVIDQGAEYATMGEIISEKYENPIIIGADHPRMKNFTILIVTYL